MTTKPIAKETISEYYEADHDRLDELFKQFQQLKRTDYPKAKTFFKEFKNGLQRHIVWEEEILFPIFEQKTGMIGSGPTEVMRAEHRQIGQHLEAIHDKVRVQDPDSDAEEQALLDVLSMHNRKEEQILYPAIDRSLQDKERIGVFQSMNEVPPEKYATCCGGHGHSQS